jgi:ubiquinone/menaquinone biosynthesis C-methylase UbiE
LPSARELFASIARASFGEAPAAADPLAQSRLAFALSRFDEGERTVALLRREFPDLMARPDLAVLDLGSGNGGMLFPFAACARLVALDVYVDRELVAFRRAAAIPMLHLLGEASALPLASRSVDVVLLAEVLEHLAHPRRAGREIARILKPGGVCLVSTPPRLKFLLRRDPHYGIPALLALPDLLQRLVARRLLGHSDYDVAHVYATSWGVRRCFPRAAFRCRVICPHRTNWTRHLAWAYLALERVDAGCPNASGCPPAQRA